MLLSLTNAIQKFNLKINSKKSIILLLENNEIRSNIDINSRNTKLQ